MKTLHLIRHAKSSWDNPGWMDKERPLNASGVRACELMAAEIAAQGRGFRQVFCSPAERAQATIIHLSEALPQQVIGWQTVESLYTFSAQRLLSWCQTLGDSLTEVTLIGHNPALTDLCNDLGDRFIDNIPTCGYVQLQLNTDRWQSIAAASAHVKVFLYPKMFQVGDA
jgi:phosphohistidine phosphatase